MQDNPRLGIALMIATTVVFAVQDGISRYLAENYNVITVVTIRYMFFMCFVLAYSSRQKGGIRQWPAATNCHYRLDAVCYLWRRYASRF